MTRAERFAQAAARARLEVQRQRLAQVQARQRDEERHSLPKRRLAVGMLADEAGLFALDNATLARLFARLSPLVDAPNPVAVWDARLSDSARPACESGPGCAHPADGVAPTEPVG